MIDDRDQWLGVVRPILGAMESNAIWARHYADEIRRAVLLLPHAPEFETRAQEEIDRAMRQVESALELLKEARAAYNNKPKK